MREIKFRVWITENPIEKSWMHYCDINSFDDINGSKNIMQYTGVCDKDGKDIYEGDIIQVYNCVGIVEYSDTGYGLRYNDGNTIGLYSWHTKKVIGNIYENPEIVIKSLPF